MRSIDDLQKTTFSGRRFTRKQLERVQETVQTFSQLSRKELALTVCEHLDWRTPKGTLKVQSGLTLLERLEEEGVITLPSKRVAKKPVRRAATIDEAPSGSAVEGSVRDVAPITLRPVRTAEERARWRAYLESYHYLGYKHPFGDHLGYVIVSELLQQELGCFAFSASAAWALAPRDRWIGWDKRHRERLLSLILSNDRFLIFPWVRVRNLASHVLSLATKQIADDWVQVHRYRPVLIETFVDATLFEGTSYRAANWTYLGKTKGRGLDDPRHEAKKTKKDIYVYPLQPDWQQSLTQAPTGRAELKKRFRNDVRSSTTGGVGDDFVALWKQVVGILHEVAADYDEKWRVRERVIGSMMLMLLIFRLVSSKNSQSYGTTIDDLWDSCDRLGVSLPQKSRIAPSSFCAARKKLDESIFLCANQRILAAYAQKRRMYRWRGHRLFCVDGTKVNLPRALFNSGYSCPNKQANYPQGLLSCLYEIRSQLPVDFDLVAHDDERRCALKHLDVLDKGDVVVYDRGYFSYELLKRHITSGIHAVFRLQNSGFPEFTRFFASNDTDRVVTLSPSKRSAADLLRKHPDLKITPLKIRLLKYELSGTTYFLATTLIEPPQRYPLQAFMDVYHSRWGIEELHKTSKQTFIIEDFHAKSERGVKQEIFAHYVLITMNRLFANQADLDLNDGQLLIPPFSSSDNGKLVTNNDRIQTNFKNCVHVFHKHLEELLLFTNKIRTTIQRAHELIISCRQRVRPGRSFPRKSLKPVPRWRTKPETKTKQAEIQQTPVPTA